MLHNLKLSFITGRIIKNFPSRSPVSEGTGPSDQRKVAELDAALNTWVRAGLGHLHAKFICAITILVGRPIDFHLEEAHYNNSYTQLALHREYIAPEKSKALGFPSLAICVNAARSLIHVLHTAQQRGCLESLLPGCATNILSAATLLLINVFASARIDELTDAPLADVGKALETLTDLQDKCVGVNQMHAAISRLADLNGLRRRRRWNHSSDCTDNTTSPTSSVDEGSGRSAAVHSDSGQSYLQAGDENDVPTSYANVPRRQGKKPRLGRNATTSQAIGLDAVLPAPSLDLPTQTSELSIPSFQSQPNFFPPSPAEQSSNLAGTMNICNLSLMPDMPFIEDFDLHPHPYGFHFPPMVDASTVHQPNADQPVLQHQGFQQQPVHQRHPDLVRLPHPMRPQATDHFVSAASSGPKSAALGFGSSATSFLTQADMPWTSANQTAPSWLTPPIASSYYQQL